MYTVWRRNDGYVNASKRGFPMEPKDLNWTGSNGFVRTFEILLHTENWNEARTLILSEREEW